MKKTLSILLACLFVLISAFPTYAYSANDEYLDGWAMNAKRINAKLTGKSDVEIAESILTELGMEENDVKKLPKEKLEEFANATSIQKVTTYNKIKEDGEEVQISQKEYLDLSEKITSYQKDGSPRRAPGDQWTYTGSDSLFEKNLFIAETKNAKKGTFGIIAKYSWKNLPLHYHGRDFISIAGEHLVFDRSSFSAILNYTYNQTTSLGTTTHRDDKYYTADNLKNENHLIQNDYAISFEFEIPNNIYTTQASKVYTQADIIMSASGIIDIVSPGTRITFNVYSKYFHQTTGISLGISASISGINVSVSPKFIYNTYSIQTSSPLTFVY